MKKIINKGKNKITYTNSCPFCCCVYSYDKEDIFYAQHAPSGLPVVTCPSCGHENRAADFPLKTYCTTCRGGEF